MPLRAKSHKTTTQVMVRSTLTNIQSQGTAMGLPKPSFKELLTHYPREGNAIGADGDLINNPAYENTCALRMSAALERWRPGFMDGFKGNRAVHIAEPSRRIELPYARGAVALANYLESMHVGWTPAVLQTVGEARSLETQGIIFWKRNRGVNHIDLWDDGLQNLDTAFGRTMLWAPAPDSVVYAHFWELRP